eukprot:TRINITY_DN1575_c1_g1_i4.p1 TRINITY_DN1575_c1_g1~~TRINITY_DN1575_c1_g1_i4.p1  ORF type:complete len:752 (+),score=247.81 TRINITY_DN1575_c1_g1_i4:270-2525(+)
MSDIYGTRGIQWRRSRSRRYETPPRSVVSVSTEHLEHFGGDGDASRKDELPAIQSVISAPAYSHSHGHGRGYHKYDHYRHGGASHEASRRNLEFSPAKRGGDGYYRHHRHNLPHRTRHDDHYPSYEDSYDSESTTSSWSSASSSVRSSSSFSVSTSGSSSYDSRDGRRGKHRHRESKRRERGGGKKREHRDRRHHHHRHRRHDDGHSRLRKRSDDHKRRRHSHHHRRTEESNLHRFRRPRHDRHSQHVYATVDDPRYAPRDSYESAAPAPPPGASYSRIREWAREQQVQPSGMRPPRHRGHRHGGQGRQGGDHAAGAYYGGHLEPIHDASHHHRHHGEKYPGARHRIHNKNEAALLIQQQWKKHRETSKENVVLKRRVLRMVTDTIIEEHIDRRVLPNVLAMVFGAKTLEEADAIQRRTAGVMDRILKLVVEDRMRKVVRHAMGASIQRYFYEKKEKESMISRRQDDEQIALYRKMYGQQHGRAHASEAGLHLLQVCANDVIWKIIQPKVGAVVKSAIHETVDDYLLTSHCEDVYEWLMEQQSRGVVRSCLREHLGADDGDRIGGESASTEKNGHESDAIEHKQGSDAESRTSMRDEKEDGRVDGVVTEYDDEEDLEDDISDVEEEKAVREKEDKAASSGVVDKKEKEENSVQVGQTESSSKDEKEYGSDAVGKGEVGKKENAMKEKKESDVKKHPPSVAGDDEGDGDGTHVKTKKKPIKKKKKVKKMATMTSWKAILSRSSWKVKKLASN